MKKVLLVMLLTLVAMSCTESETPEEQLKSRIEGKWKYTKSAYERSSGEMEDEEVYDPELCYYEIILTFSDRTLIEDSFDDYGDDCTATVKSFTYTLNNNEIVLSEEYYGETTWNTTISKNALIMSVITDRDRKWEKHYKRVN